MNKKQIQTYINNFRRRLARYLKPGIGLNCSIYSASSGGAILVFQIGSSVENDDVYQPPSPNLGQALAHIEQRAFGGNLDGVRFGGTNVILEPGKIIFIKDDSDSEWSDAAAAKDVRSVLHSERGANK